MGPAAPSTLHMETRFKFVLSQRRQIKEVGSVVADNEREALQKLLGERSFKGNDWSVKVGSISTTFDESDAHMVASNAGTMDSKDEVGTTVLTPDDVMARETAKALRQKRMREMLEKAYGKAVSRTPGDSVNMDGFDKGDLIRVGGAGVNDGTYRVLDPTTGKVEKVDDVCKACGGRGVVRAMTGQGGHIDVRCHKCQPLGHYRARQGHMQNGLCHSCLNTPPYHKHGCRNASCDSCWVDDAFQHMQGCPNAGAPAAGRMPGGRPSCRNCGGTGVVNRATIRGRIVGSQCPCVDDSANPVYRGVVNCANCLDKGYIEHAGIDGSVKVQSCSCGSSPRLGKSDDDHLKKVVDLVRYYVLNGVDPSQYVRGTGVKLDLWRDMASRRIAIRGQIGRIGTLIHVDEDQVMSTTRRSWSVQDKSWS